MRALTGAYKCSRAACLLARPPRGFATVGPRRPHMRLYLVSRTRAGWGYVEKLRCVAPNRAFLSPGYKRRPNSTARRGLQWPTSNISSHSSMHHGGVLFSVAAAAVLDSISLSSAARWARCLPRLDLAGAESQYANFQSAAPSPSEIWRMRTYNARIFGARCKKGPATRRALADLRARFLEIPIFQINLACGQLQAYISQPPNYFNPAMLKLPKQYSYM